MPTYGIRSAAPEVEPWIGYDAPSLETPHHYCADADDATIDLPDYDLRKLMTTRDPLCSVQAFKVMTQVVLPTLYGLRMCPECPHCALSDCPCMDAFGSNATPMGGAAGRADALIGAVEAQKVHPSPSFARCICQGEARGSQEGNRGSSKEDDEESEGVEKARER